MKSVTFFRESALSTLAGFAFLLIYLAVLIAPVLLAGRPTFDQNPGFWIGLSLGVFLVMTALDGAVRKVRLIPSVREDYPEPVRIALEMAKATNTTLLGVQETPYNETQLRKNRLSILSRLLTLGDPIEFKLEFAFAMTMGWIGRWSGILMLSLFMPAVLASSMVGTSRQTVGAIQNFLIFVCLALIVWIFWRSRFAKGQQIARVVELMGDERVVEDYLARKYPQLLNTPNDPWQAYLKR